MNDSVGDRSAEDSSARRGTAVDRMTDEIEREAEGDIDEDDSRNDVARTAGFTSLRRRPDWGFLAACFVIAVSMVAIGWAVAGAVTGQDGIERPEAIERISPVENAQQVIQQEQIVVDLQFGYEAVLVIDGIELPTTRLGETARDPSSPLNPEPGDQVSVPPDAVFDPGNSRIEFRPSEDALITSFTEGRHQAQVIFWRIEDGREAGARSYRWSFDVV